MKGPQSLVGLVMTGQTPIHKENKIDLFPEDIVPVDSSNILLKIGKPASGLPEGQPGSSPPRNLWDQRILYFLYKLLNSFPFFPNSVLTSNLDFNHSNLIEIKYLHIFLMLIIIHKILKISLSVFTNVSSVLEF